MNNLTWPQRSVGSMLVLGVVALAVVMSAGFQPHKVGGSQDTTGIPSRPECPITDSIIVDTPYVAAPASIIPVAGPLSHIPEFHDCQRFIRRKLTIIPRWLSFGWRYDSLYAIFASFRLDSLWLDTTRVTLQRLPCDSNTVMDARHPCFGLPRGTQLSAQGQGVAFAEIVSWGGTYNALGIGPGYNCLYLFGPAKPRAFMVRQGLSNNKCDPMATFPTGANVKELVVQRDTLPVYAARHYPPVARWDWDRVNAEQYIGIRCGAGWCEVGDTGFQSGMQYVGTAADLVPQRRVVEIKGWYDEQRLDVGIPSGIRGTVFPSPALGTLKTADFKGHWVPTAFVSLAVPHKKYQATFNFGSAVIGPGVNFAQLDTIELCLGSECDVPISAGLTCDSGAAPDSQWWARIKRAATGQPPKYKCVTRRGHEGLGDSIPGTVRWRWMGNDETVWMRCDVGCCEVHP